MPLESKIDKDRRLLTTIATGVVTFEEAITYQRGLTRIADFDASFNQLIDLSEVSDITLTSTELRSLAQGNPLSRTSRVALLAPEALTFGISRMLQAYNEFSPAASLVGAFRDLPSALRFLEAREEN